MTARSAATIASLALLGFVTALHELLRDPDRDAHPPKMDVSPFQRVLVAGFISGGTDDVDANLETVRLLRSQLRSKSSLRVIEAEVLPLAELATEAGKGPAAATTKSPPANAVDSAARQEPAAAAQEPEPKIRNEKDLEKYQAIFADVAFWKKIGEEYQNPLIVTGTILFTPHQSNGFVMQNREVYDKLGRRSVVPVRTYMERKGFILAPNFIFIDGRTGTRLHSESMSEEILYNAQQNTPALSSYFELMDRVIPSFLGTLSTQKIRGTRVLLR